MDLPPLIERVTGAALWAGDFRRGLRYRVRRPAGGRNHLLLLTSAGAGRIGHAGGWVAATPRTLIAICPQAPHDYGTDPQVGTWTFRWAHAGIIDAWSGLVQGWPEVAPGIRRCTVPAVRWAAAWEALGRLQRRLGSRHVHAVEMAYLALAELLLLCAAGPPERGDERIARVCRHALAHLAEPMPVAALARVAGVSEVRFAHLFRAQMGMPPRRWLERQRLDRAAVLLAEGDLSVTEVAARCGFDSPFRFSLRFRLRFGHPPSRWRRGVARPRR
jgi:AraC family transcriptional regulator of arabinose operon